MHKKMHLSDYAHVFMQQMLKGSREKLRCFPHTEAFAYAIKD